MIFIICAWIYCFLLSLSIGSGLLKLISKRSGKPLSAQFDVFYRFWFGFVVLIGILQAISLFLPINNAAFIIVSLLGLISAVLNVKGVQGYACGFWSRVTTLKGFVSLLIIVTILLLVSYMANKSVTHTDTFLYHFNAVKWAREYPVVPGLVNLHNRLGFNSSFFLFAAFTEVGIYENYSAHVALSFLMAACLIHWFVVISDRSQLMSKRIFCLLTVLFLVAHTVYRMDIASLSTDYPMAVLTLVFCLVVLDKIDGKVLLLLPIAAAVFTFKLSGMLAVAAGLAVLAGCLFRLRYDNRSPVIRRQEKRTLSMSFILLCFVVSGFVIRNVIISGWLLYPFPVGNVHLPWSVSKPYVMDMIDVISSYPKIPGGASAETIRNNSFLFWFIPWSEKFKQSYEAFELACALLILLWSLYQRASFGKFVYGRLNIVLVLAFAATSILFWFYSAPDIRFGSIYFYILFAASVALLYEGSAYKNVIKVFAFVIFIYQIAGQVPAYYFDGRPSLFTFPYLKPFKLNRVVASPPGEDPPLYIYMPAEGNQCGNSPIPCTPYAGGLLHVHQAIRQRVPGDLSKGFLPPPPDQAK